MKWSDIRAERAGGEEAVAERRRELMAEQLAYQEGLAAEEESVFEEERAE